MSEQTKTAWIYLATAVYLSISLYLLVQKDIWLFFALPAVLGVLLLYVYALDIVLLLVSFLTPLSLNIENMDAGLAISLPVEPMLFGILVLFFAKLLHEGNYDRRAAQHPISLVVYLMFFWMFITTLTSELPLVSAKAVLARLWFVVPAYFLAIQVFRKLRNIHWFIWLYNISLILVIAYTIYRHWTFGFSDKSAHWVMSPLYNDHTAYGAALAMFLILTVGYIFYPGLSHARRFWVVSMAVLLAVATLLSLSRAAWISLVAAAGVYLVVWLKIKFRYILAAFVIFVLFVVSFQHQIIDMLEKNKQDSSADIVEHVQSIYNISSDASNLERINRWQAAFRLFEERPIFGWGLGTYQFVYGPFQRSKEKTIISTNAGDGGNAHSEYIGPLSEMGLPGMLIMFLLVGTMVYQGLRTYQRARNKQARILSLSATLALVSYFTHGFLNNFLDTDKLSVPVWGSMAIIVALRLYHSAEVGVPQVSDDSSETAEG